MLMGLVELLHRGAGVIASPIVNENERLLGLSEDGGQELLVGRRAESRLDSLGEETTGAVFDGAEDLGAFGFTGGLRGRLLAPRRSSVAQRTPLGKAGLIGA